MPSVTARHDFAHAMTVEAAALERQQRDVMNPGADIDTRAHGFARGFLDVIR